ncbi:MAG TPA: peptidylprolyl isomerase [Anaerolineae bacterium]|nr:peptidylprolyl isomerase [Anaerolineae bacterium]
MSEAQEPMSVADDLVISMEYELTVGGEIIDSSKETGPIDFLQGRGNIIPGLESELYNMALDESKEVIVQAKDGYGDVDQSRIVDVPKEEFPPTISLQPGLELQMKDEGGNILHARVVSIGEETVKLDFNHPLAGQTLHFNVTIVGLRNPTDEELEHGHAHS